MISWSGLEDSQSLSQSLREWKIFNKVFLYINKVKLIPKQPYSSILSDG